MPLKILENFKFKKFYHENRVHCDGSVLNLVVLLCSLDILFSVSVVGRKIMAFKGIEIPSLELSVNVYP